MVRILLVLVFLAVAAFCAFGFAASFEPLERGRQLVWRIVYGAGVFASLTSAGWTLFGRRQRDELDVDGH